MLTRAANRAQSRYNLRSASKGNSLLQSFPYSRLTSDEVLALFQAYSITLGTDSLDAVGVVEALKQLDRADFDNLLMQAFSTLKHQGSAHRLSIVRNALGQLVVQ